MVRGQAATKRRFPLILIKPSHYDDDGYVIRWWRTMIPSNSLAAIYGIAADCAERQVLGPDVDIDIEAIDETNTRIDVPAHPHVRSSDDIVASVFSQSSAAPHLFAERVDEFERELRALVGEGPFSERFREIGLSIWRS